MTLGRLGLSDHRTDQLQKIFQTLPDSSGQSTAHGPAPPRCCCADRSTNPTIQTKAIATSRSTDRPSAMIMMTLHTLHSALCSSTQSTHTIPRVGMLLPRPGLSRTEKHGEIAQKEPKAHSQCAKATIAPPMTAETATIDGRREFRKRNQQHYSSKEA